MKANTKRIWRIIASISDLLIFAHTSDNRDDEEVGDWGRYRYY